MNKAEVEDKLRSLVPKIKDKGTKTKNEEVYGYRSGLRTCLTSDSHS